MGYASHLRIQQITLSQTFFATYLSSQMISPSNRKASRPHAVTSVLYLLLADARFKACVLKEKIFNSFIA